MAQPRLFISYRRDDSAAIAGRIYDRLVGKFGKKAVFKDVDDIPYGVDFRQILENAVQECAVELVIIGRQWLDVTDKDGKRRLDDSEDFVRIEVEAALRRNILAIPLLVSGAAMPSPDRLPPGLVQLAYRHAAIVRDDPDFHHDMDRLIEKIELYLAGKSRAATPTQLPRGLIMGAIGILTVIGLLAVILLSNRPDANPTLTPTQAAVAVSVTPTTAPTTPVSTVSTISTATLTFTHTPPSTLTPTRGPGTSRTDAHGMAQVYVPAGCFMMGSTEAQVNAAFQECEQAKGQGQCQLSLFADQQPQHQVCFTRSYWMDVYEVTNAAYQQFVDAGGYTTRDYWSDVGWLWKQDNTITGPQDYDGFTDPQQPRVGVAWYEAEAYATWRGGRLPTEAEWEYAARGPEALIYPWGNTWDSSSLNAENRRGKTAPVGSYESGKSWIGAYELAGNVLEWVTDWYDKTYYQQQVKDDPVGPTSGKYRVLRGGSWRFDLVSVRASYRSEILPGNRYYNCGFRIVSVPAK